MDIIIIIIFGYTNMTLFQKTTKFALLSFTQL